MKESDDDKKSKVVQLFGDKAKPKVKDGGPKITNKKKVVAKGQNNVAIGKVVGDVHFNALQSPKRQPRTVEQPPVGSVTDAHRRQLQNLVDGIVKNTNGKTEHRFIWKKFKDRYEIPKYQHLPESKYADARKWLLGWYGSSKRDG